MLYILITVLYNLNLKFYILPITTVTLTIIESNKIIYLI